MLKQAHRAGDSLFEFARSSYKLVHPVVLAAELAQNIKPGGFDPVNGLLRPQLTE